MQKLKNKFALIAHGIARLEKERQSGRKSARLSSWRQVVWWKWWSIEFNWKNESFIMTDRDWSGSRCGAVEGHTQWTMCPSESLPTREKRQKRQSTKSLHRTERDRKSWLAGNEPNRVTRSSGSYPAAIDLPAFTGLVLTTCSASLRCVCLLCVFGQRGF